jgi:hypothetical protein
VLLGRPLAAVLPAHEGVHAHEFGRKVGRNPSARGGFM